MRYGCLTVVTVAALLGCVDGQQRPSAEEEAAILNVVVDSLPLVIDQAWGNPTDQPHTALLDIEAVATRLSDQLEQYSGPAQQARNHAAEWVEEQVRKEHIVGSCSSDDTGQYCDMSLATVLARISQVRLTGDNGATVEVSVSNRGFVAVYEIALGRESDSWAVTELKLIIIS